VSVAGVEPYVVGVLERDRELERIGAALDAAVGGVGGVLLIEGPAGIGKTTLAAASAERAARDGIRVLRAIGRELERDFPFGVVRQLFDPVLRSTDAAVREKLLEGVGAAGPVFGLSDGEGGTPSEFATLHGLYWLLANLSDGGQLLLLVDDAHWADQASLRFLAFLASRLLELPVLLTLYARADEWEPESLFGATASEAAARPVVLAPLSPGSCASLVRMRLGEGVDDVFCTACHRATGGNPFLLSALLDEVATAPGAAGAEAVMRMGPRVVTRSIVARLGRLSAAARPVATALAVLGDGASMAEVAGLTGLVADEVRGAVGELAGRSILAPGGELRFAHPIIRNSVYSDVGLEERERLHRAAAVLLEGRGAPRERVAAHLLVIEPAGEEHVCDVLRVAAAASVRAGANHSAVAYLRRALAEPCREEDRGELSAELGLAEMFLDGDEAVACFRDALVHIDDPSRFAYITVRLAHVLIYAAQPAEAVAACEDALGRIGAEHPDLRRRLQGMVLWATMTDPTLIDARRRVLDTLGDFEHEVGLGVRTVQAMLLYLGRAGRPATALASEATELLADEVLSRDVIEGYPGFSNVVQMLIEADSDQAVVWLDRHLGLARRDGNVGVLGADLMARSIARFRRGDLADAKYDMESALQPIAIYGGQLVSRRAPAYLALAHLESGDVDLAEQVLADGAASAGLDDRGSTLSFLRAQAAVRYARGDFTGSLAVAESVAGAGDGTRGPRGGWSAHKALCLQALGEEPDRARALADREVEMARPMASPWQLGAALRVRGVIRGEEESLRDAVSVLDGSICKLEHAKALVELGAMLRRCGRRREAREPLRDGLELARICGAAPLAARAEDELRASGSSPRNVIVRGIDALTASERRVSRMAADGMSNKQIAQSLYVTVKTVETHLHRAYQKLDVTSRAQLLAALERSGSDVRGAMDANSPA
jgi:DNA-binding CsgD family transcriptional regulator